MMKVRFAYPSAIAILALTNTLTAENWPQWRYDSGRTAASPQNLGENLQIRWIRRLPPLEPAFRDVRLQFDKGYEPVILGKRLFVASSREDSVIALDTETGERLWRFFAEGPIRFAPVAWGENVCFGSDDGRVYCLNAADGSLRWKFRAVPSERKLLGNRRLISVWPVRGGPVFRDGRVYFAAGVWPFEGVFVYALDAESGEVVWRNERCGHLYGVQPHNAVALGGLAPQGYLLINGGELIVPSSNAYPARFDLKTGELLEFELPAAGRKPGGWFVSTANAGEGGNSKLGLISGTELAEKRALLFDRSVNAKRHEDRLREEGKNGVRTAIFAGKRRLGFEDELPGVNGVVHTMLAADGKLFVVTLEGEIYCLAPESDPVVRHEPNTRDAGPGDEAAREILAETGAKEGLALVLGSENAAFLETLARESNLGIVAIQADGDFAAKTRKILAESGLNGHRVAVLHDDPRTCDLPAYLANLIVAREALPEADLRRIANSVRPFGGKLVTAGEDLDLADFDRSQSTLTTYTRSTLPGSTNYTGDWEQSADELVRAPVGVLWFDDALGHFKRSPQPKFIDGVMISADKTWTDASTRTREVDYRLQPAIFSDVYTGRVLTAEEAPVLRQSFADIDLKTIQPSKYRPPRQLGTWKPGQPHASKRANPLTGEEERRVIPKSYGCDGGFNYGYIHTMRSATAAFYDKRVESGTINLAGPRSGCTNSVIPANGLLNVPYFFEGCTCSYPLPAAMALVSLPATHEQWANWGEVPAEALHGKIQRLGVNLGAPGDRMTQSGTLWLDFPNQGPSPQIQVNVEPVDRVRYVYRHSAWIRDPSPEAWPWVAASAVIGAESIRIQGLEDGTYQARLIFAELEGETERDFDVLVQNQRLEPDFRAAGGEFRAFAQKLAKIQVSGGGTVEIRFEAKTGEPSLSGIELVRRPSP